MTKHVTLHCVYVLETDNPDCPAGQIYSAPGPIEENDLSVRPKDGQNQPWQTNPGSDIDQVRGGASSTPRARKEHRICKVPFLEIRSLARSDPAGLYGFVPKPPKISFEPSPLNLREGTTNQLKGAKQCRTIHEFRLATRVSGVQCFT